MARPITKQARSEEWKPVTVIEMEKIPWFDFCNWYSTKTKIRIVLVNEIKSRRMRWAGLVARMGEERGCIGSWWGNRKEGDHWGDLGVDGWIILGWISRRWDVGIWTGLGWTRIETGGGLL